MPRLKVRDLVPAGDLPPAAQVQRFITFYTAHRDLKLAACQARMMPEMGERLYKEPKVRSLIDHKIMLVDVEEAKLKARANLLTVPLLDSALVDEVRSKKNGHIRIRAIELGYKRTGLIKDGEFYVAPDPNQSRNQPSIYQTTMRRTVTEEVVQSAPNPIFAVKEY